MTTNADCGMRNADLKTGTAHLNAERRTGDGRQGRLGGSLSPPGFGNPTCRDKQAPGSGVQPSTKRCQRTAGWFGENFTKTLLFLYRLRVFLNPSPPHSLAPDIPRGTHKANSRLTAPVFQTFSVSTLDGIVEDKRDLYRLDKCAYAFEYQQCVVQLDPCSFFQMNGLKV
jgi:hypothetical protein